MQFFFHSFLTKLSICTHMILFLCYTEQVYSICRLIIFYLVSQQNENWFSKREKNAFFIFSDKYMEMTEKCWKYCLKYRYHLN